MLSEDTFLRRATAKDPTTSSVLRKDLFVPEGKWMEGLVTVSHSIKYRRFPFTSSGFTEGLWEVIWKRFLTRKLTKRKMKFQFVRRR